MRSAFFKCRIKLTCISSAHQSRGKRGPISEKNEKCRIKLIPEPRKEGSYRSEKGKKCQIATQNMNKLHKNGCYTYLFVLHSCIHRADGRLAYIDNWMQSKWRSLDWHRTAWWCRNSSKLYIAIYTLYFILTSKSFYHYQNSNNYMDLCSFGENGTYHDVT